MSDQNTYPVQGNVDFRAEQAFVDVLKDDDTIKQLFHPDPVDIRRSKDISKGAKSDPAYAVDCVPEQSVPETNEYHLRMQITCTTYSDEDPDKQHLQALEGAVRDALHVDSTSQYTDPRGVKHFKGDCKGFLEKANKTQRNLVFWKILEVGTSKNDDGRVRTRIFNVDAWGYPGRA